MLRVLELYAGIGGAAAALGETATVVAAIEQSPVAAAVYRHNLAHRVLELNIAGLDGRALARFEADLWWMSPPCQSFTLRGARRDLDDPRARSFIRLMGALAEVRPRHLALENVPGFAGSRAHQTLRSHLDTLGYQVQERLLCPTELGVPGRRQRFYLLASRSELPPWRRLPERPLRPLASYLDHDEHPELTVPAEQLERYAFALARLDPRDPTAITTCFTSAYGTSPVKSGSYLCAGDGLRRFAPEEILRLLGFPRGYHFPAELPRARAYALAGNSLSLDAVREVLGHLPALGSLHTT